MTTSPQCLGARLALLAGHDEPAPPAARAHVAECPACRRFVARDRALASRIRTLPRLRAPDALRGTVAAAAAQRAAIRRRRDTALRSAVAVAAAGLLAVPFLHSTATMSDVVVIATTQGPTRPLMMAGSPQAVRAWLRRRFALVVDVPAIGGATMLSARSLTVRGTPVALVFYRMGTDTLTYVTAVGAGAGAEAPHLADTLQLMSAGPRRIVVWEEPGGLRAVAAAMSEDALLAVAAECRHKALMRGS